MFPKHQQGFGLPTAIFIITVLAVLAISIGRLGFISGETFIREVQSTRAFYSAESGAQLAAVYALHEPALAMPSCNNNFISDLSLNSCTVNVTCESIYSGTVYTFVSTATCGSGSDLAQRRIMIRVQP